MAKTVANLSIQLSASTATLTRDFATARGAVQAFAGDASQLSATMRQADQASKAAADGIGSISAAAGATAAKVATLLVAATTAAFGLSALREQATKVDEIAKFADRVGTTTEELTRLRYAANLAGGGGELLDTSLQKLARNLGDARQGNEEAIDSFSRLGLSADRLAKGSVATAFVQIADAINALPTPADRAAAAVDVFGKSGAELLNVLALGSKGIQDLGLEADLLGISFGRVDASKIESANDAFTKFQESVGGIARELAVALSPATAQLFERLASSASRLSEFIARNQAAIEEFGLAVVDHVGTVVGWMESLVDSAQSVIEWFEQIRGSAAALGRDLLNLASPLAAITSAFEDHSADAIEQRWQARQDAAKAAAEESRKAAQVIESALSMNDKREAKAIEEQRKKLEQEMDHWSKIGEQIAARVATPKENLMKQVDEINEALARGVIDQDLWNRAIDDATKKYAAAEREAANLKKTASARPAAVVRGTAAGRDAVIRSQDALAGMVERRRVDQEVTKTRDEILKRSHDRLTEIRDAIKRQPPAQEVRI